MEKEQGQIKNVKKPFGIVSDSLITNLKLSITARLAGAWIEGRSENFAIKIWYLREKLGLTRGAWLKARKELIDAGYLTVGEQFRGKRGRMEGGNYEFHVPENPVTGCRFTGHGGTVHGGTVAGGAGPTPTGVKPTRVKPKKQQQPGGGGGVLGIVKDQGQPQPQGQPVAQPRGHVQLSEILGLGITGPQSQQLDQLAHGASIEQLEMLRAAHAAGMTNGKIKSEGAWLAVMARKAVAGAITEVADATCEGGGRGSVIEQLRAVSVPAGTVIMVGEKQLIVEHIDGVPRVLADRLSIGPQRSLKLLQRVHSGELSTSTGGAS